MGFFFQQQWQQHVPKHKHEKFLVYIQKIDAMMFHQYIESIKARMETSGKENHTFCHWLDSTSKLWKRDPDLFIYLLPEFKEIVESKLLELNLLTVSPEWNHQVLK